ncbi:MAG TPA: hypothetical protein VNO30_47325 [Kofleriaceae bacterium]|nr:hypothetical protein [Kofleriaceae bacterium]
MKRQERLRLIFGVLEKKAPADSSDGVFQMMEEAFDEIEDIHSGIIKNPDAASTTVSDGRMYPPHPSFKLRNVEPPTYRHRGGHKTVIAPNGSFRIFRIEADLSETIIFEKHGADGKGYWDG